MFLLRNFDKAKEYIDIDSFKVIESDISILTHGWYKIINKNISAIFVLNQELYLQYQEVRYLLDNTMSIQLDEEGDDKVFLLLKGSEILMKVIYPYERTITPAPFDYIDASDFDWGVFLSEIVNDKNRKLNFIKNNL